MKKKVLIASCVAVCGLLTACSQQQVQDTPTDIEQEVQLNSNGYIELNNNDKYERETKMSADGRYSYCGNSVDGITLLEDRVEVAGGAFTVPDSIDGQPITKIGKGAYKGITATSITIPESVKIIDDMAFMDCHELESVVFASNVVEIRECAFQNCYKLKDVTLNDGLYRLGKSAFSGCYALTRIDIPSSVAVIDNYCFTNTNLESIKLPDGMYYIAEGTFMGCSNLKSVEIPDSIEVIDHQAFADCTELKVELGETVQRICQTAFTNASNVEVNEDLLFSPHTLTYMGDFSEFEDPQIVRYFYSTPNTTNETEID